MELSLLRIATIVPIRFVPCYLEVAVDGEDGTLTKRTLFSSSSLRSCSEGGQEHHTTFPGGRCSVLRLIGVLVYPLIYVMIHILAQERRTKREANKLTGKTVPNLFHSSPVAMLTSEYDS